jgi:hypothetical protein
MPVELDSCGVLQGFEGTVAKRRDSLYEPGKRSGSNSTDLNPADVPPEFA